MFYLLAVSAFICSFIITAYAYPVVKELPEYKCIPNEEEFIEYKNYRNKPTEYKIIYNNKCIQKYCGNNENFQSPILWVVIAENNSIRNLVFYFPFKEINFAFKFLIKLFIKNII